MVYNCHSLVCIAVVIMGRAFFGGCLKVHFGMMSSMEEQRHCHGGGGDCAVPPFRSRRRHSCSCSRRIKPFSRARYEVPTDSNVFFTLSSFLALYYAFCVI